MPTPPKEIQLRGDSVLQLPFLPPRSLYGANLGDLNDVDVELTTDGAVVTRQPDGSFALEELPGGLGAPEWGDITGTIATQTDLASALAGKVDASALSELIDDRVAALLVAGTNITVSYNDASNTYTVNSTGGGGIGGSTGATDNRLLRADGTGGATVQSSAITVDDSGNVSGVGTIASGAITSSAGISGTTGTFTGIVSIGSGSGTPQISINSGLVGSTRTLKFVPVDESSTYNTSLDLYVGSTSTTLPAVRLLSSAVSGSQYVFQLGTGVASLAASTWHFASTVVGNAYADSLPLSFTVSNSTDGRFSALAIAVTGIVNPSRGIQWTSETVRTPTGTTQTIALNTANHQTLALTSATGTVTATLTVPTGGSCSGTIIVRQHASAAKGITWAVSSGSIKWLGTEPTWGSDAVNSYRIVSWRWNGSIMFLASTDAGT